MTLGLLTMAKPKDLSVPRPDGQSRAQKWPEIGGEMLSIRFKLDV